MSKTTTDFINMAYLMAEDALPIGDTRMACVLTFKNKIVSIGTNQNKKHPMATKYTKNKYAIYPHAEIIAIHKASKILDLKDFKKVTLYVARAKKPKRGDPFVWGLAKPCPSCKEAINSFGIKKIVYTTDFDKEWIIEEL